MPRSDIRTVGAPNRAVLHLVAAVCWGCILLSGNSAAQTAEPGPVRVGDRWTYETKDAATGDIRRVFTLIVAEITIKEITTRVGFRGKDPPRTMVFDPQWGLVDDGVVRYRPASFLGIRTPLTVGKEWRSETNGANTQTGNNLRTSTVTRVVAAEQVTTAAGTFDTFRVEADVAQVNSKDATKASKAKHVFWYAPAINRWVKRTFEVRFEGRVRDSAVDELTEYSRKP
jgi:hypothetical protein